MVERSLREWMLLERIGLIQLRIGILESPCECSIEPL